MVSFAALSTSNRTLVAERPGPYTVILPDGGYRDDGCELARTCLNCPLPVCKYDDPDWGDREDRRSRDAEIVRLRYEGMPVSEIAAKFGVSSRTVHRVVKRGDVARAEDEVDPGPLISLEELEGRSIIRKRVPWPSLFSTPSGA